MRTGLSLTVCRSLLPGGVCSRGGGLFRGMSAPSGGVCSQGGVCSRGVAGSWRGVCSWRRGVYYWVVSAPRGGWCPKGGGWHPSMHWGRPNPLWTEWMTDRCKNITLATTALRPVINTVVDPGFAKVSERKAIIWQDFCRKLHENKRNLT